MLLAETDLTLVSSPFLQYGSFGLNVLLLIWFMWKGAPMALEKHREAVRDVTESAKSSITKIVDDNKVTVERLVGSFEKDSAECREERLAVAQEAALEREKDRVARHEMAAVVMKLENAINSLSQKIG